VSSMAAAAPVVDTLVHCELLYFLNGTIDNHPSAAIKSTISGFYRDDEILNAKQKLVGIVEKLESIDDSSIQSHMRKRIGDNKVHASLDDIFRIFQHIDESGQRDKLPAFCAVMRSRVLILTDELSDIAAVRTELSQLRQITDQLSEQISGLKLSVPESSAMPVCNHCSRSSVLSVQDSCTASVNDVAAVMQTTSVAPMVNMRNAVSVSPAAAPNSLASSSLVMDTDFAATVNENMDKLDDMQAVAKKNKKNKKKVIIGATDNAVFKGVCKKSVVCVSRLEPGTTADIVEII